MNMEVRLKPNELRIGNLIQLDRVVLRTNYNTMRSIDLGYIHPKPIPLTEEWLLKFGIEWDIYWQGHTDGNWVFTENSSNGFRIAYGKRRHDIIHHDIKHIHQLQNLYYALTGSELTIKN